MVTIKDAAYYSPMAVKVDFPFTQSGSGTPSPTNPRPIAGASALSIYHSGADASEYDTYAISFPAGAGTVYIGELTIDKTGAATLTVEYACIKGGWTLSSTSSAGYKCYLKTGNPLGKYANNGGGFAKSNMIGEFGSYTSASVNKNIVQLPTSGTGNAFMALDPDADPDDVEVLYVMQTPAVYTLSVAPIISRLGVNKLWESAGTLSVTAYDKLSDIYFIFNGIKSTDMGIKLNRYPPFTKAQQRIESVTVPGSQGDVTLLETDEPMFDPYIVTLDCFLKKTANPDAVIPWLSGFGSLIIGNRPNRVMQAQIVNQIDYNEIIRGRNHAQFPVPFKVQPLKGAYPAEEDVSGTGTLTLTNPGHAAARPIYTITAVADDTDVVMTVGDPSTTGATLTVELPEGVSTFIYDADSRICVSADGTVLLNSLTTIGGSGAEGLYLPRGVETEITPTLGISSITVTPRWRYLA